jgi:hypothetical protein
MFAVIAKYIYTHLLPLPEFCPAFWVPYMKLQRPLNVSLYICFDQVPYKPKETYVGCLLMAFHISCNRHHQVSMTSFLKTKARLVLIWQKP